jgi:3-oxoacyl-[acyl-carrier protein] reductase
MRVAVTGASRGIGRAIALGCGRAGATVGVGYRASREAAGEVCRAIEAEGGRAHAFAIDLASQESVAGAIAEVDAALGGLDGFVSNAAMHVAGPLVAADPDALARLVATNVLGPILCAREVAARMMARRRGVLLFVGSVAASRPARGQAAYAATKGSLEALTRALAVEYARKGLRTACIRPGAVDTDMLSATKHLAEDEIVARVPMRRLASPDEIARLAVFLLGDGGAYVNGAIVDVDGGYAVA